MMKDYLKYFYEISDIPHGSGNTSMISDYLVSFAEKKGLYHRKDKAGNVVIIKEASEDKKDSAPVILQAHMDMVTVKEPGCDADLLSEGLKLYEEDGLLKAQGTSLGGDDGIGVAYMLSLLDEDMSAPRLECIFTVDEEVGMLGADAFSPEDITGKIMINIDQEEEGIFIGGCAGGERVTFEIPLKKEVAKGHVFEISVDGFKGGHSGIDISKCRGNAIHVLLEELCKLDEEFAFNLIEINGGDADNAIPRSAVSRVILTEECDTYSNRSRLLEYDGKEIMCGVPGDLDEGTLHVKDLGENSMIIADTLSTMDLLGTLSGLPCGVYAMNPENKRVVETSLNLGIISSKEESIALEILVRSEDDDKKEDLIDKLCELVRPVRARISFSGRYTGWRFKAESPIRDLFAETYEKMFLCKPKVEAIHAGLECGIFASKIPGLDCISIGPTIHDIHTYKEAMDMASAERMYGLIKEVLSCI